MSLFLYTLIFVFGCVTGSFLGAYSYRYPREIPISKGRSFCPKCKKKIEWHDNIPLVSFILLSGKCRKCGKAISIREPLIELGTGILFVLAFYLLQSCPNSALISFIPLCGWSSLPYLSLPYLYFLLFTLITIFVVDMETQIIPEGIVLIGAALTFMMQLIKGVNTYEFLLAGFGMASFLLFLNLVTKGKGMGLGDVKFAVLGGLFFGWRIGMLWLGLSFVIGAIFGLFLIAINKARFGKHIAFGPFLVTSFLLCLFFGDKIAGFILPYI